MSEGCSGEDDRTSCITPTAHLLYVPESDMCTATSGSAVAADKLQCDSIFEVVGWYSPAGMGMWWPDDDRPRG